MATKKARRKKVVGKAAKKKTARRKAPTKKTARKKSPPGKAVRGKKAAAKKATSGKRIPAKRSARAGSKTAKKKIAKAAAKKPSRKKPAGKEAGTRAPSAASRRAEAVRRQLGKVRIGTFEELFADSTPELQAIAFRLRDLIYEILPKAQETVYLSWRIALYKQVTEICGIQPAGDRCNFYLWKGAYLHDPQGLLEGTGKRIRHVKVRSVVGMAAEGIRDLLKQALEFQGP